MNEHATGAKRADTGFPPVPRDELVLVLTHLQNEF